MKRRCSVCREEKDPEEFSWKFKDRGVRDSYCRACRAQYKQDHYAAIRQRYIDNAVRRKKELARKHAIRIVEYLRDHPCLDCGETDPIVLEFDHLRDKKLSIGASLAYVNWSRIEEEIAKCEVVCANCHRRRTARRGGFVRLEVVEGSTLE